MSQENTISVKEKSYLVNFKVAAIIEGECIIQNSNPNEEDVLKSVHDQLKMGGLIDFTTDKCQIICIDKVNITPIKEENGIVYKIGEMFNLQNIMVFINQRLCKKDAAKCSS